MAKNDNNKLKAQLSKASDTLKERFSSTGEEAKEVAKEKLNKAKTTGGEMVKNIEDTMYDLGKQSKEIISKTENVANQGIKYVEGYTKENPSLSVGMSFLIGALVGWMISKNK